MPALSRAPASRSMSVAGAARAVAGGCSAVVMALLPPYVAERVRCSSRQSRQVPANGLLDSIAPLGPEAQRGKPGRVAQHPAMLGRVGYGAELLLERALAIQVERHAPRLERALHHGPGHQLRGAIPAVARAVRPHPQVQLPVVHEKRAGRDTRAVGEADRHGAQQARLLHVAKTLEDALAAERHGVAGP